MRNKFAPQDIHISNSQCRRTVREKACFKIHIIGVAGVVSGIVVGDGVDVDAVADGGGDVCEVVAMVVVSIVRKADIHETILVMFG
jgi:hypothetical protein